MIIWECESAGCGSQVVVSAPGDEPEGWEIDRCPACLAKEVADLAADRALYPELAARLDAETAGTGE